MDNNKIYRTLAELEESLQNINTSRQQVDNVISSNKLLSDAFSDYQKYFSDFSNNLKHIITDNHNNFEKISGDVLTSLKNDVKTVSKKYENDLEDTIKKIDIQIESSISQINLAHEAEIAKLMDCYKQYNQILIETTQVKNNLEELVVVINDTLKGSINKIDNNFKRNSIIQYTLIALMIINIVIIFLVK